jgi:hypothetical protein
MIDMSEITAIAEIHIFGFREAVDVIAREKKYLDFLEAPPLESTRAFVMNNIKQGYPQFVTLDVNSMTLSQIDRGCSLSLWHLGYWLLPEFRGRGIGDALMLRPHDHHLRARHPRDPRRRGRIIDRHWRRISHRHWRGSDCACRQGSDFERRCYRLASFTSVARYWAAAGTGRSWCSLPAASA